jgi:valyl-tRNA synthetase
MRGKCVFYPVGWDDNGLPTERRVQSYFHVRCDPALPYDPGFVPPASPAPEPVPVSRRNFVDLCHRLTDLDEQAFEEVWLRLGLSVDWSTTYRTAGGAAREISQRAFLRNLARGEVYLADAPALWDTTFRTGVAQGEICDRQVTGLLHRIRFLRADGEGVLVATTRPELLPACVALVVHPSDSRYAGLAGTTVRTPLFGVSVPVLAHPLADPAKGTGIAMVCTFGDVSDLIWWRDLHLPVRTIMGADGRLAASPPAAVTSRAGRAAYRHLAGQSVRQARTRITTLLRASGDLAGTPEPVVHAVKFYDRGSEPLEIVTTRQWYLRNGAGDPALAGRLIRRGGELAWHPAHMRDRYRHWVNGLSGDWPISRQRFLGVPVPVWYPLDADGRPRYEAPIVPADDALPVDPAAQPAPGYTEDQRGKPGGFAADPDVLDTWATSSLTPQIAARWSLDGDLTDRVFPMDLRPQAHEIIRTWLFYTVLRSELEHGMLPWRHAAISGWILDPERRKMSKSAGNVVTPMVSLREYGSDALRYWAASCRLGVDATFDRARVKVGRRLATKILNAARFVLSVASAEDLRVDATLRLAAREPLDAALLERLACVIETCTRSFEAYDHAGALAAVETFFRCFCDDYLELVKARARGAHGDGPAASARSALLLSLSVMLRLFAPFLPFVTEEVWSWWHEGSIHRSGWPASAEVAPAVPADPRTLPVASAAIGVIRAAKSSARVSMRAPVRALVAHAPRSEAGVLTAVLRDVAAAGRVERTELQVRDGVAASFRVVL